MESFGWKNLFEDLIHSFGDVMSVRNEQQEKFKCHATWYIQIHGERDRKCTQKKIVETTMAQRANKCDFMWICYKWSEWIHWNASERERERELLSRMPDVYSLHCWRSNNISYNKWGSQQIPFSLCVSFYKNMSEHSRLVNLRNFSNVQILFFSLFITCLAQFIYHFVNRALLI